MLRRVCYKANDLNPERRAPYQCAPARKANYPVTPIHYAVSGLRIRSAIFHRSHGTFRRRLPRPIPYITIVNAGAQTQLYYLWFRDCASDAGFVSKRTEPGAFSLQRRAE